MSKTAEVSEIIEATAEVLEQVASEPPETVLMALEEIFLAPGAWLSPSFWVFVWHKLSPPCQSRICYALALSG